MLQSLGTAALTHVMCILLVRSSRIVAVLLSIIFLYYAYLLTAKQSYTVGVLFLWIAVKIDNRITSRVDLDIVTIHCTLAVYPKFFGVRV